MAEQVITFDYSIGEKITVLATGNPGWVAGLFLGTNSAKQYNINTTKTSGEPIQFWVVAGDITPFEE